MKKNKLAAIFMAMVMVFSFALPMQAAQVDFDEYGVEYFAPSEGFVMDYEYMQYMINRFEELKQDAVLYRGGGGFSTLEEALEAAIEDAYFGEMMKRSGETLVRHGTALTSVNRPEDFVSFWDDHLSLITCFFLGVHVGDLHGRFEPRAIFADRVRANTRGFPSNHNVRRVKEAIISSGGNNSWSGYVDNSISVMSGWVNLGNNSALFGGTVRYFQRN